MGYAVKILNCDSNCRGCYETKVRNRFADYDVDAICERLVFALDNFSDYNTPNIHGGEPLLIKIHDLERMFRLIYTHKNKDGREIQRTSIQTNLRALTDKHIKLFQKYNTNVGVSVDGKTETEMSGRGYDPQGIFRNMKKLRDAGVRMSVITLVRKGNCNADEMIVFVRWLARVFGITGIKINPVIDFYGLGEEPAEDDLALFFRKMTAHALSVRSIMIQPFRDVVDLMIGGNGECIFTDCDPFHTTAEIPIFNDGSLGVCLKNYGANRGLLHLRAEKHSSARDVLQSIPHDTGGCKDCKYWFICRGGCPGSGIDNDWRNRTRFCLAMRAMFDKAYEMIKNLIPNAVLAPDVYPRRLTRTTLYAVKSSWMQKDKVNIDDLMKEDNKCPAVADYHADRYTDEHGDVPHGDHTDDARGTEK